MRAAGADSVGAVLERNLSIKNHIFNQHYLFLCRCGAIFRWSSVTRVIVAIAYDLRILWPIFWVACAVFSVCYPVPLMHEYTTSNVYRPPQDRAGGHAFNTYSHYFPHQAHSRSNYVFIARTDGGPSFTKEDPLIKHIQCKLSWRLGCSLCAGTEFDLRHDESSDKSCPYEITSHWSLDYSTYPMPMSYEIPGYPYLPELSEMFAKDKAMLLQVRKRGDPWRTDIDFGKVVDKFAKNIMNEIDVAQVADFRDFQLAGIARGPDVLQHYSTHQLVKDLWKLAAWITPWLVVWVIIALRGWRPCLLMLTIILCTLLNAFAFISLIGYMSAISIIAPPIIFVLVCSVGSYYGLIMLSIYQQELPNSTYQAEGEDSDASSHVIIGGEATDLSAGTLQGEGTDDDTPYMRLLRMVPVPPSHENYEAYRAVICTVHITSRLLSCHAFGLTIIFCCCMAFGVDWITGICGMFCIAVWLLFFTFMTFLPAVLFTNPRFIRRDCLTIIVVKVQKCLMWWKKMTTFWFFLARVATTKLCAVFSAVVFVTAFGLAVWGLTINQLNTGELLLQPRGATDTWSIAAASGLMPFSRGRVDPYNLVFIPQGSPPCLAEEKCMADHSTCRCDNTAVWTDGFWSESQDILEDIIKEFGSGNDNLNQVPQWSETQPPPLSVLSPLYAWPLKGRPNNARAQSVVDTYNSLEAPMPNTFIHPGEAVPASVRESRLTRYLSNKYMSRADTEYCTENCGRTRKSAVQAQIDANYDPMSIYGREFAGALRDFLTDLPSLQNAPDGQFCGRYACVAIAGGSTEFLDMVEAITDNIVITLFYGVLIFIVFACLAYHLSLLAILRSTLSTVFVFMVSQCICMGIWQLGWLGNNPNDAFGRTHGVSWFQNLFGVALIFGLILGHDFLLFRDCAQYRDKGWDTRTSFALGLTVRGSLLADTAFIMGICWIGLIFTSVPMLNQLGFLLFIAVCVDTLFVRVFYVGVWMTFFGEANWWPLNMEPVVAHQDDDGHAEAMRINASGPLGQAIYDVVESRPHLQQAS